jgi:hypothetical protein
VRAAGRRDRALRHLVRTQEAYQADRERRDPPAPSALAGLRIGPEALERMGERVRRMTASFTVRPAGEDPGEPAVYGGRPVNPSGSGLDLFDADDFAKGAGQ